MAERNREDWFQAPANEPSATAGGLERRDHFVCHCLAEHGQLGLWDVAEEVTVWESGTRLPDLPPDRSRMVYLALYHTHLPRLERAGLVTYDPTCDLVRLTDAARDSDHVVPATRGAVDDRAEAGDTGRPPGSGSQ